MRGGAVFRVAALCRQSVTVQALTPIVRITSMGNAEHRQPPTPYGWHQGRCLYHKTKLATVRVPGRIALQGLLRPLRHSSLVCSHLSKTVPICSFLTALAQTSTYRADCILLFSVIS